MIWIVLTIIVALILLIVLGLQKNNKYNMTWKLNKKHIFVLLSLIIFVPGFITKVPVNSVGIKYSPFTGTSETTLDEGFHVKNVFDKVYNISTEVQTTNIENMTAQTQDAQYVNTWLDVKYRVNQTNAFLVFTQFRTLDRMSETLITPTVQRALESVTTKYNVIDILGEKRNDIYKELQATLTEEFAKSGVEFYSVSIIDMDAGDEIEKAITAEAVAKKAVETAEQELLKSQTEAKRKSVIAKAEQEAAQIDAETKIIEAQAEKEANELLQQSLTENILMQQWINKWDGKVPTYYGGSGADLIFNTGTVE